MTGYLIVMAAMVTAMIAVAVYVLTAADERPSLRAGPATLVLMGSRAGIDGEWSAMFAERLPAGTRIVDARLDSPLSFSSVDRQLAGCAGLGQAVILISCTPPFEEPEDDVARFEAVVGGLAQRSAAAVGSIMMLTIPRSLDGMGSRNAVLARLCHAYGGQLVDVDDGSLADVAAQVTKVVSALVSDEPDAPTSA